MLKYTLCFILSFPISIYFYSTISSNILSLKKVEQTVYEKPKRIIKKQDIESKLLSYSECLIRNKNNWENDCENIKKRSERPKIKKIVPPRNYLIDIICALLVLALNFQLALFCYTFWEKEKISIYFFHLSDWAINSPPILGVLGTITSFAMLMNSDDIQKVFADNFFNAAITTIIGGVFYTINLFLKIRILPRIKNT